VEEKGTEGEVGLETGWLIDEKEADLLPKRECNMEGESDGEEGVEVDDPDSFRCRYDDKSEVD
jgi:hypothetical protein